MPLQGLGGLAAELQVPITELSNKAKQRLAQTTQQVFELYLINTPVWSGETVNNYHVSIGSPTGSHRDAVRDPPAYKDIGPTNSQALGAEARRPANEAAPRSELQSVLSQIKSGAALANIWISNTSAKADAVDNGELPGGKGQVIRNKGGTTKRVEQQIAASGDWRRS